jgi:predicted amidohydrolase YtcJ
LEEYSDRAGHFGYETFPMSFVEDVVNKALKSGFQVCTHGIGYITYREVLDKYEAGFSLFPEQSKNHRFRMEHAQHIHPNDIPRFAALKVIPYACHTYVI